MRHRLASVVFALALLAVPGLSAHHSYAGFETQPRTVEGAVESFSIANPHTLIVIRTRDHERFTVVMMAINGLRRQGLLHGPNDLRERLHVGDHLSVTGRIKRDEGGIQMLPDAIDHQVSGRIWGRPLTTARSAQPGSNR